MIATLRRPLKSSTSLHPSLWKNRCLPSPHCTDPFFRCQICLPWIFTLWIQFVNKVDSKRKDFPTLCNGDPDATFRPQLHWNVWVTSDVIWNKFHAAHWLTEKRKEGVPMECMKLVSNDIWCTHMFQCNQGLTLLGTDGRFHHRFTITPSLDNHYRGSEIFCPWTNFMGQQK